MDHRPRNTYENKGRTTIKPTVDQGKKRALTDFVSIRLGDLKQPAPACIRGAAFNQTTMQAHSG
jgi:hypothetical protein